MRTPWTLALLGVLAVFPWEFHVSTEETSDSRGPSCSGGRNGTGSSDYVELSALREEEEEEEEEEEGGSLGGGVGPSVVIRKCCGWNSSLDVENLKCVRGSAESVGRIGGLLEVGGEAGEGDSGYVVREGMPECGVESVVAVWVASSVSLGVEGVQMEGEGAGVLSEYCVDGDARAGGKTVVLGCVRGAGYCRKRTCYRKCCPLGYAYEVSERKCERTEEGFRAAFYELSSQSRVEPPGVGGWGIYVGDGCGSKGKYKLDRGLGEESYLGLDGSLLVPALARRFPESEFCVEIVKTGNWSSLESFLCFPTSGDNFQNSPLQFLLLSSGLIISCMFLLLTFLVYLCSPKRHNLYEKTLMCYIACLFAAYLGLAVIELGTKELNEAHCTHMGYFLLFAFLAAFFWLNVISFDIWKTFRSNRSVERSKADPRNLRFLRYSLYAWGFPSAVTSACAYANQVLSFPYEDLRPDIGVENCWFSKKKKGIYVFFIAPISFLIALNVFFYVQTAWKIWKVKADVNKMEKQKTKRFSANRDQFVINGKLFVVMGITWSLEIISFFAPHPIWYITDTANALHGVFVFAVFVLKKKVLRQLSEQVRLPLKRMRQLASSYSEEVTARKNCRDPNAEGRSSQDKSS